VGRAEKCPGHRGRKEAKRNRQRGKNLAKKWTEKTNGRQLMKKIVAQRENASSNLDPFRTCSTGWLCITKKPENRWPAVVKLAEQLFQAGQERSAPATRTKRPSIQEASGEKGLYNGIDWARDASKKHTMQKEQKKVTASLLATSAQPSRGGGIFRENWVKRAAGRAGR